MLEFSIIIANNVKEPSKNSQNLTATMTYMLSMQQTMHVSVAMCVVTCSRENYNLRSISKARIILKQRATFVLNVARSLKVPPKIMSSSIWMLSIGPQALMSSPVMNVARAFIIMFLYKTTGGTTRNTPSSVHIVGRLSIRKETCFAML